MSRAYQKGSKSLGQVVAALLEDGFAVAMVGLTLLGVAGVVYRSLKPDGWISSALDSLWHKSPWLVWLTGFVVALAILAVKHTYDRSPNRTGSGNFIVYGFVALGLFFFFKLFVTGSL
jgi:hypothetical protein